MKNTALKGLRIVSLALNLPGPAALARCHDMGARCSKFEPPQGDPMKVYCEAAYKTLHKGITTSTVDLKTDVGQATLHKKLATTDVLLTSFRPSALRKLGLDWRHLHKRYPSLSQVAVVGYPGDAAERPGHDLTYMAEIGLLPGLTVPRTLYADMGGALMVTSAVMQAALHGRPTACATNPPGILIEVPLSGAAGYLALPLQWGLTAPTGMVGGAHAGYRVYRCQDGRVAVAALEERFSAALCAAAGMAPHGSTNMLAASTHHALEVFMGSRTRQQLNELAAAHDIPLHALE